MKDNFEISMIGEMKFFLGLQVHQSPRGIFICQSQYTLDLLKNHEMEKCYTISTPMATTKLDADLQGTQVDQTKYHSMIGGLMYLTASRPDIAFVTFVCARYQAHPTKKHLKEVKRIFHYLRQTINMGLWYLKDSGFELNAYSYADHAGCNDDCKITSGGIQFLGEKLVSWSSKEQDCTSMSTAKVEYVSLSACCAQVIWMRTQLLDYGFCYNKIPIYCDSKSAIAISCNPVQHSRTKHIDIRYHFIKEHVEKGFHEQCFPEEGSDSVSSLYQIVIADLMKKFPNIPKRQEEEYHTIMDDAPLVSVCTTGNVLVREFCNKHNMIAFLEKTDGSDDFHQIIDFLSASYIHYSLTVNPTIFTSLIKQFWKNAALTTDEHEVQSLTAGYWRGGGGCHNYGSMAPSEDTLKSKDLRHYLLPHTNIYHTPTLTQKVFSNMRRETKGFSGVITPLFETMLEEEPIPVPYDSPLYSVHSHGREEGSMQPNELMVLVTQLSAKVDSLESQLSNTKRVYSTALTKQDEEEQGRNLMEELELEALVPPHLIAKGRNGTDEGEFVEE
ncbi:retrovirus-related pol polyprotein from transposon TNT 1-94 [Tanacetum coccineum]